MLTLDLCCIVGGLVQRGAEALGQGVAPGTGLRAELALCAVFGVWGGRNTVMRQEVKERNERGRGSERVKSRKEGQWLQKERRHLKVFSQHIKHLSLDDQTCSLPAAVVKVSQIQYEEKDKHA